MLLGVCALLGDLSGLPAWLPRVAFALFAMAHLWLAVIVYGALFALVERREKLRHSMARGYFSDVRKDTSWRR
jgi:phage shock protein PspC (stress-responsive transcriptional regulator)